jgi:crooked neck
LSARGLYSSVPSTQSIELQWCDSPMLKWNRGIALRTTGVWDRVVTFCPRVEQLWLRYMPFRTRYWKTSHFARLVFTRWLKWMPDISAYVAFVQFEMRHGGTARSRGVFELMVNVHPSLQAYLKYATFEERHNNVAGARSVFERAADVYSISMQPDFFCFFRQLRETVLGAKSRKNLIQLRD